MKKSIIFLLVAVLIFGSVNVALANTTGFITADMLQTEGFVIDSFDLTKSGARERFGSGTSFIYNELDGNIGCYQIKAANSPTYTQTKSRNSFKAKGNYTYKLSMLVKTELVKASCEVSVGFAFENADGQKVAHRTTGLPVSTNGEWQRVEYELTAPAAEGLNAYFYALYTDADYDTDGTKGYDYSTRNTCFISDLRVVEMPPSDLKPLASDEGLTFGGSSGNLGLRIEDVTDSGNILTVRTNGASFEFDKSNDTVTGTQLINEVRKVVTASFNKSLSNLSVLKQSDSEVILTTGADGISFGVQMDSMMFVSNHGNTDLETVCTSEIDGKWNRLAYGHLVALDLVGGFTVNPSIPAGTGRTPRYEPLTELDFEGKYRDVNFLSSEQKGWQVKWTTSSGELLGISVFPPREQRVGEITTKRSLNTDGGTDVVINYEHVKRKYGISNMTLWNFTERGYGMSNSSEATPKNEQRYINHIDAIKEAGQTPISYISFYFWHNRDVDEYINEVKRHRDVYGIEGIYSDGLPAVEWIKSYECMRRLRELFPNGEIALHATGISENGGPPLSSPDIFIPAIETYADRCVRCEDVEAEGTDWVYPKYCCNGKITNGTLNSVKGNKWIGAERQDTLNTNMLTIVNNSLLRISRHTQIMGEVHSEEIDLLDNLQKYREIAGFDVTEADESYYSLARRLARKHLTLDTKTDAFETDFSSEDNLKLTQGKTGYASAGVGGLIIQNGNSGKNKAEYSFDAQNGKLNIEFGITVNGEGPFFINIGNTKSNGVSIMLCGGSLYAINKGGGYSKITEFAEGEKHTLKIETDAASQRYGIVVDGMVVIEDIPYSSGIYTLNTVKFEGMSGVAGKMTVDTMKAIAEF